MSQGKRAMSSALAIVIAAVIGSGVAGCAKNSNGAPTGNAPSVTTTENGQAAGSSNQQQAQSAQSSTSNSGQTATQPGKQQAQANGQPPGNFDPQQMQANLKQALSGLVSEGTITQAQADKVVQYLTDHQRSQGQNPFEELVSNGTLTQDQANAVRQAMPHLRRTGGSNSGQANPQ